MTRQQSSQIGKCLGNQPYIASRILMHRGPVEGEAPAEPIASVTSTALREPRAPGHAQRPMASCNSRINTLGVFMASRGDPG